MTNVNSNMTENIQITNGNMEEIHDTKLQKPTFYNQYLPFGDLVSRRGSAWFEEIRENLSRTIQMGELRPGFSIWSYELHQFLSLYGFHFTKAEHLKLVDFYLSILTINDLNYSNVQICLDRLHDLLRKTRLITRDDLTIDWRVLYRWGKLIFDNHDQNHALITLPKDIKDSFFFCMFYCSPYFSATSTQEILDEFRPLLCPIDWTFSNTIRLLELFLPVHMPPNLHDQAFKLWLPELFGIWDGVYNDTVWELRVTILFSCVAWYNIGYINWEPWMSQIFTRILRGLSLPIGKLEMTPHNYRYLIYSVCRWIICMIGNRSSCLQYLQDLFIAIKTFYHPSNTGDFQEDLVSFVLNLSYCFVERLYLERKPSPVWQFSPHESFRLTEEDITDFVNCVKEYAFISIFNKDYAKDATEACQYLSILRPELIVPPIVEMVFESIDNTNEPHRFTSIMTCLTRITRELIRQTSDYSQGQTYVLPLLMSVLPGIDLNDFKKTSVTLEFLNTMFMLITCVDCSSAVNIRNDLDDIEIEVCLSTAKFDDFIHEFLNRIFQIIKVLSTDTSDAAVAIDEANMEDSTLESNLKTIMTNIVQQCSSKIFRIIREKIIDFVTRSYWSSKVRKIVASLVRAIVLGDPAETLKYLLPKTCDYINKIMNDAEGHGLLTDHKGDKELTWYLYLFSELLRARGDTLIIYKQMIISVFHRCIQIIHKGSYKAVASAAKHLLKSLTHIHLINNRSTIENIDGPYVDFLPIRMWGQPVDVDKFQAQYYIPGDDELNFVREFVETFMYLELELLKEKSSKLSNEERLRSLTIVHHIATGCFRVVPRISSPNVQNLEPTVVPYSSQSQVQYSMYSKQPKFRENIRLRLLIDIGKLLDMLVTSHSDDVSSIKIAHKIYSATSIYYGGSKHHVNELRKEFQANKLFIKNRLCSERQNPRFLIMKRIALQLEQFEIIEYATLTEIDKQVALKLFELSTNRYSEVRRQAQNELFSVLNRYRFSSQVLVDRIIELLNASGEVDHDQIKGCLYILLGNNNCFLPTEDSWATIEKLWPTLVRTPHASKISTQNLITDIKIHINKVFVTKEIIQNLNEKSIRAAAVLWHPLESNEMNTREVHNQANIQLYNRLMETLSSLLKDNILTWRQQETAMAFLCLLLQRQIPIPSSCIQTSVNLLVHDHSELRKYAAKSVAAICRLQKTPRIYVEKTLDKILQENQNNGSTVITHDECQPGDRDDNLWITIDNYKPPESQAEWEQTCFMDKTFLGYYTWPNIIKYPINKRAYYTQNDMPEQVAIIYNRFIDKNFIIQLTNLTVTEWHIDDSNFDFVRFFMFKALFRNFGLAFVNNFIEQVYVLIRDKTHEKQEGSHRVAAEIVAAIIRGSKYWTLEMLDELWTKLTPLLTEVCLNLDSETLRYWNTAFNCAMEHEDPRRMYRLVEFIRTLIDNQSSSNTFNETSRWSLIQTLRMFEWRIPSIWCDIYEHAKDLLDHSFKSVREHIATVLSMSFSFDVRLFNGDSKRHPNINQCMDVICDKLHRAIEIYEKTPLVNVYGQFVEIDAEACKALNVIETVILMHTNLFTWCRQPIKNGILRLFPYLCEIESVVANDPVFKRNLATSRMHVAMAYLHGNYLEILIEQLEEVCASPKWHARQAAIEFVQSMIFCNLFNARPYALRLHDLVLKCLFDERLEVRTVASTTLSGLYQCGYIQMIEHDLKYFRVMAKTKYLTKIDSTKVKSAKNIIKRHGGALGLCAIVLSSPYDIPTYLPEALMVLCEHSHDPDPIQKSIKQCLSEFRRTHYDSWHEHQEKFTERQLLLLADAFISRSYYA